MSQGLSRIAGGRRRLRDVGSRGGGGIEGKWGSKHGSCGGLNAGKQVALAGDGRAEQARDLGNTGPADPAHPSNSRQILDR